MPYMRRSVALLALAVAIFAFTGTIQLVDIAAESGLTVPNTYGGTTRKDYILETTGNGIAILDYDGDGWNDIFVVNGTTLQRNPGVRPRTPQLYRNDGTGHFTDVAAKAGF